MYIIIWRLCNIWHIIELLIENIFDPNTPVFGLPAIARPRPQWVKYSRLLRVDSRNMARQTSPLRVSLCSSG